MNWICTQTAAPGNSGACSAAVARAILWHTLMEYAEGSREIADLAVITGRGHGSGSGGPILPTSTREFLMEVAPAIEIREVPSNPGMFEATRGSICAWVHMWVDESG